MPNWDTPAGFGQAQAVDAVLVEESKRAFMARVYRWMFFGLALTGGISLAVAASPEAMAYVGQYYVPLIIAELGLVILLSWLAPKLSGAAAGGLFTLYAALSGVTFSVIFFVYELGSIGQTFLITAGMFAALSVYGTVTKKDLSAWRTFLMMGLFGLVISGVASLFFSFGDQFYFVRALVGVVVFAGLTAYDTQKLRELHATSAGGTSVATMSVVGALILYLDFINLFLHLLRVLGRRR